MTTFGGATIPPIFGGGGGGFLDGDIFVRGLGALDINYSNPAHDLDMPTIVADDILIVKTINIPSTPAGWILAYTLDLGFGGSKLYRRKATGTAADAFPVPAASASSNGLNVSQMVSIGNKFGFPLNDPRPFQQGINNDDTITDGSWFMGYPNPPYSPGNPNELTANTSHDPRAFVIADWYAAHGGTSTPAGTIAGTNPYGLETLSEAVIFTPIPSNPFFIHYWWAWYFGYYPVSVGYSSYLAARTPTGYANPAAKYSRWFLDI